MKKQLKLAGLSCQHCVNHVTNALADLPGVSEISVDLATQTASFNADQPLTDELIRSAIEEAGYEVVEIN